MLLDEDELDEALGREWIDGATADRARAEADRSWSGRTRRHLAAPRWCRSGPWSAAGRELAARRAP